MLASENKEIYVAISTFIYYKLTLTTLLSIFLTCSVVMVFYPIHCNQLVTENTTTGIDNIFNNNLQDDIVGGNLLLTLSEHFSQFISVNREIIDLKKIIIYQRDYSKFSVESFRDDVSITMGTCSMSRVNSLKSMILSAIHAQVHLLDTCEEEENIVIGNSS